MRVKYGYLFILGFSAILFLAGCENKNKAGVETAASGVSSIQKKGQTMVAVKGKRVKVQYEGKLETGEVFDKSAEGKPLEFVLGSGQIIPGFDNGVQGMQIGEKKQITIDPENAYGPVNEELFREIPRSEIPDNIKPEAGMILRTQTPDGQPTAVVIREVKKDTVKIDFNHPLAGKKLIFDLELIDIE
jgi:FKBP-type peptidyl-prolyl cis-trans isomerase 2